MSGEDTDYLAYLDGELGWARLTVYSCRSDVRILARYLDDNDLAATGMYISVADDQLVAAVSHHPLNAPSVRNDDRHDGLLHAGDDECDPPPG